MTTYSALKRIMFTNNNYMPTFQYLMVLSFVERRNSAPFAVWHHRILLIFSSISKLLR